MPEPKQRKQKNYLVDRMIEVSGLNEYDMPNAQLFIVHSNRYSDGTAVVLQQLDLPPKPVVHCFKHAGYVNVLIDFLSRDDADLAMAWDLLTSYSSPENSIDWSEDELNTGIYTDLDGRDCMVYFPMVELVILPSAKINSQTTNDLYQLHGMNPLFYTLQPNGPKGEPCVLQLTFAEDWFVLDDDIAPVDMDQIRNEVMEEMAMELGAGMDPKDLPKA